MRQLRFDESVEQPRNISPFLEMGAYEALWQRPGTSFRRLAKLFADGSLPSDFVDHDLARGTAREVRDLLRATTTFEVQVRGAADFPGQLADAQHPLELLYSTGHWNFVDSPALALVGTRTPSEEGRRICARLAKALVEGGWTIVSGLAEGIDTVAHRSALDHEGRTIGVLGTPLSVSYPAINRDLQRRIGARFLLISQVPVLHYAAHDFRSNRRFFPARNETISALTQATILVEIGDTNGSKHQADAAVAQRRPLFLHDLCFQRGQTWPQSLVAQGVARRFGEWRELKESLGAPSSH